jgi:hypothetical protein
MYQGGVKMANSREQHNVVAFVMNFCDIELNIGFTFETDLLH